jgi:hypothetical protein
VRVDHFKGKESPHSCQGVENLQEEQECGQPAAKRNVKPARMHNLDGSILPVVRTLVLSDPEPLPFGISVLHYREGGCHADFRHSSQLLQSTSDKDSKMRL